MNKTILDQIRHTAEHDGYTNQATIAGLLAHIDGLEATILHLTAWLRDYESRKAGY